MHEIRVHFDNGDYIDTRINGDIDTIVHYYLDHQFPFLDGRGKETMAKARCVEFLDSVIVPVRGKEYRLIRVYSISDSMLKRHQLYSNFRFTVEETRRLAVWSMKYREDAAYVPGMFGGI